MEKLFSFQNNITTHSQCFYDYSDKIVLENTNFNYVLGQDPNDGTLRETVIANQLSNAGHRVTLAEQGDFLVDDAYTLEVGGANKKKKQIATLTNAWVVRTT